MTAEGAGLYFDYSKNRITDETLSLLLRLAEESGLQEHKEAMFCGERINVTEDRSVLHVALRMPKGESLIVDGVDVIAEVNAVLDRMSTFADRVRSGEWRAKRAKAIRNIISIGIGGSDLGPMMAYEALRDYTRRDLTFRFVSNVDSTDFAEATRDLAADETLFIISSKTFTTLETMNNAYTAREWAMAALGASETPVPRTTGRVELHRAGNQGFRFGPADSQTGSAATRPASRQSGTLEARYAGARASV